MLVVLFNPILYVFCSTTHKLVVHSSALFSFAILNSAICIFFTLEEQGPWQESLSISVYIFIYESDTAIEKLDATIDKSFPKCVLIASFCLTQIYTIANM